MGMRCFDHRAIVGLFAIILSVSLLEAGSAGADQSTAQSGIARTATASGTSEKLCSGTTPVKVGVPYQSDLAAGQASVGHSNNPYGSAGTSVIETEDQKVFDDINRLGGFAGCMIEPVFDPWSITESSFQTQSQEECAKFSQDNHVVVDLAITFENLSLADCMAHAHVPVLWGSALYPTLDNSILDRHPGLLYSLGVSTSRMGSFIGELARAGYLSPGTKLGVVIPDAGDGVGPALWKVWDPELAARHVDVAATFTVSSNPEASEAVSLGQDTSQDQAAVLRFKAAGVNHVLFLPGSGVFTFIPAALAQDFRPRYAMTTDDQPLTEEKFNNPTALADAVVIGWSPQGDGVPSTQYAKNATSQTCAKFAKEAGTTTSITGGVEPLCDDLLLLRAAYAKAPSLSYKGLESGFAKLGTSFVSATGLGPTHFGPSRFDGVAATRIAKFNSAESTFEYSGPSQKLP
jgi:hypothetical protein